MVRVILLILVVTLKVNTVCNTNQPEKSQQCMCPPNAASTTFPIHHYCGTELKELNANASIKVEQGRCIDDFVYKCTKRLAAAVIVERCGHSCVTSTEEIQMKYNISSYPSPLRRWCVKLSASGKYIFKALNR